MFPDHMTMLTLAQEYNKMEELRRRYVRDVQTRNMLHVLFDDPGDNGGPLAGAMEDAVAQFDRLVAAEKKDLDEQEWVFLNALFNRTG